MLIKTCCPISATNCELQSVNVPPQTPHQWPSFQSTAFSQRKPCSWFAHTLRCLVNSVYRPISMRFACRTITKAQRSVSLRNNTPKTSSTSCSRQEFFAHERNSSCKISNAFHHLCPSYAVLARLPFLYSPSKRAFCKRIVAFSYKFHSSFDCFQLLRLLSDLFEMLFRYEKPCCLP